MPLVATNVGIIDVGRPDVHVHDIVPNQHTQKQYTPNLDITINAYGGSISPEHVYDASGRLLECIGFDAEWFVATKSSLVQLACASGRVYLFYGDDEIKRIQHVLENPRILKLGIGVQNDIRMLTNLYGSSFTPKSFVSLEQLISMKYPNLQCLGLQNTTSTLLNQYLCKKQQCANWKRYPTQPMIDYAARDAHVSLALIHHIMRDPIPSRQVVQLTCCNKTFVTYHMLRQHMKSKQHK